MTPPWFMPMNTPRRLDGRGGGEMLVVGNDREDPSGSSGEGRSDQEDRPGFEGFEEHGGKVVRGDETSFSYERKIQPMPKLGPWVEELERQLKANEKKARKDRLSLLRIHEDLGALGYGGGYDAVRRYARAWRRRWRLLSQSQAFVPLSFDPGEAYQFDWSHEYARLSGVTTKVKAAHMRLCYSRMQLVQIFPRESPGDGVRGA